MILGAVIEFVFLQQLVFNGICYVIYWHPVFTDAVRGVAAVFFPCLYGLCAETYALRS